MNVNNMDILIQDVVQMEYGLMTKIYGNHIILKIQVHGTKHYTIFVKRKLNIKMFGSLKMMFLYRNYQF